MPLIVDDLMLVLLSPMTGRPLTDSTRLPLVLAGALLFELAIGGAVRITGPGENVRQGRVVAIAGGHADPLVAEAIALINRSRPMKPEQVIETFAEGLQPRLILRLQRCGQITPVDRRILGIFSATDWYPAPGSRREAIRAELQLVLAGTTIPLPRAAALISLLSAVDAAAKVFPEGHKQAIRMRAKQIAASEWAARSVRDAVAAVEVAIVAEIAALVADAGSSS